jgi:excisionase family DNA binding protein
VIVRAEIPADVLDDLVERVADLVLARLPDRRVATESQFLTVKEAAELLRCSRQRVYDLLSDGRLTRHKDGSRVLISRTEVIARLLPTVPQHRTSRRFGG